MREAVCVVVPSHAPYINYVGSHADYVSPDRAELKLPLTGLAAARVQDKQQGSTI